MRRSTLGFEKLPFQGNLAWASKPIPEVYAIPLDGSRNAAA
jgi:hypothetical protein